jgi:hypothetical protein
MLTALLAVAIPAFLACLGWLGWEWLRDWYLSLDRWPQQCQCGDPTRHAPGDITATRTLDNENRYRRLILGGVQGRPRDAPGR